MGTGTMKPPALPPMPGQQPGLTDDAVTKARRAALRTLAARQGLQSTFLTTPAPGSSSVLGDLSAKDDT